MSTFTRMVTCPTVEALSGYAAGCLAPSDRASVGRHLSACDFCNAALQLLTARPQANESKPPEAPPPLLVLLLAGLMPTSRQSEPIRLPRAA